MGDGERVRDREGKCERKKEGGGREREMAVKGFKMNSAGIRAGG